MPQLSMHSPIGDLAVSEEAGAIVAVDWGWGAVQDETPLLLRARDQLNAYFDGKLRQFDLPCRPAGVSDQTLAILGAISRIPYGHTRTYGELADELGMPAQQVGQGCGANPIPIIIPCHRVVAAGDRLGGYSGEGGVETKISLLRLEGARLI